MDALAKLRGHLHHGEVTVQGARVEAGMEAVAPDLQHLSPALRGQEAGAAHQHPAMRTITIFHN